MQSLFFNSTRKLKNRDGLNNILANSVLRLFSNQVDKGKGALHEIVEKVRLKYKLIQRNKEIYTIPNAITLSRIMATPFLTAAIVNDMKVVSLGGCCIFFFSDWLDGYLATKLNQKSVLGAFLDPLADKIMIASLTLGLCWKGMLPLSLTCLIVGRDVLLTGITFYVRAKERAPG